MSNPYEFFQYEAGELCADGVPIRSIVEKTGTPAYIYSSQALLKPLRELGEGLKGIDHLICFAVKANSNLAVLNLLSDAGAGTDLVSGGELFRALKAGVNPGRIVFSGVGKSAEEMETALHGDIFSFNVESVAELELLNSVAEKLGRRAHVSLRFNPDVDAKTHPYISTGLKKNKFGLEKGEVLEIVRRASALRGIHIHGLSIHIGSQLLSLAPLEDAFIRLKKMRALVEKILGYPLEVLDLGGGVGIIYKNEKPPTIDRYCKLIMKHFGPKSDQKPVKIVIEPGRSLSGNAGILVSRVMYRKPRGKKDFVIIDAAMNDLARPSLYGSYHEIVAVNRGSGKTAMGVADIVGPVCESSDCFATGRKLPKKLGRDDLVAILSAGAYGFSMSSNYNSRVRPVEVLVHEGEARIIRDRENLQDLIRGETLEGRPIEIASNGGSHARNLHGTDQSIHVV